MQLRWNIPSKYSSSKTCGKVLKCQNRDKKGIDLGIINFNVETMLVNVFILISCLLLEKCYSPNLNVTGGLTFSSHGGGSDTT